MILEHILSDFTLSNTIIGLESDHQVSNYLSLNDRKLVPKITTRAMGGKFEIFLDQN